MIPFGNLIREIHFTEFSLRETITKEIFMALLTQEQKQRLLDLGYTIAHQGKINQANCIFNAILMEKPVDVPALIGKALTSMMLDKFAESEEILLAILEKSPQDQEAIDMLALTYFLSGNNVKAKEFALKVNNTSPQAYAMAQELLAEIG